MRRGARVLPILGVGLAGAGAALAVAVYLLSTEGVPHAGRWAALALLTSWSFVGSGVLAWIRRPASRIGPLMIATGVALPGSHAPASAIWWSSWARRRCRVACGTR